MHGPITQAPPASRTPARPVGEPTATYRGSALKTPPSGEPVGGA
jgi:hypothetical protein